MKFLIHILISISNNMNMYMCLYVCILPLNIYIFETWNLCTLNEFSKLRKWLIPWHAIWGLCWYIFSKCAMPLKHQVLSHRIPPHSQAWPKGTVPFQWSWCQASFWPSKMLPKSLFRLCEEMFGGRNLVSKPHEKGRIPEVKGLRVQIWLLLDLHPQAEALRIHI